MSTAGSFNISRTRYRDVRENFMTAHFSKLTSFFLIRVLSWVLPRLFFRVITRIKSNRVNMLSVLELWKLDSSIFNRPFKRMTVWKDLIPSLLYFWYCCERNSGKIHFKSDYFGWAKVNCWHPLSVESVSQLQLSPRIKLSHTTICHDPSPPIFLQDAQQNNVDELW